MWEPGSVDDWLKQISMKQQQITGAERYMIHSPLVGEGQGGLLKN